MILLSRYYREANIDQLVILKQHGENEMSRFYLPLGKKNAKPSRRRKKATRFFDRFPLHGGRTSTVEGEEMDALKWLQGICVVL